MGASGSPPNVKIGNTTIDTIKIKICYGPEVFFLFVGPSSTVPCFLFLVIGIGKDRFITSMSDPSSSVEW